VNKNLIDYLLQLADSNLILAQQNAAWCGHGPILEQDIALTNITLDLIGQSRNYYQYAAELMGDGSTEDTLAYLRTERDYKNCLICEQPNGDWAQTILRQFFFSAYQQLLLNRLQVVSETRLAAIAEKSLKEVHYHVRWSSEWVIRLGDGTDESKTRILNALDGLWAYTGELLEPAPYEKKILEQFEIDTAAFKEQWHHKVSGSFEEAGLPIPAAIYMQKGGKTGVHTEHLGFILSDLQYLQRTYPNAQW
jgi:ring-1,2-phenylacetyl-CoA epoxidase subunit PaaC